MFEVQLVVDRLDAVAAFYRDAVGLEVSLEDRERGRTHFRLGRGQLILARAGGEDAAPDWPGLPPPLLRDSDRRGRTPERHGAIHFAIEVELDDLLAVDERLRVAGHDVRGPFRWPGGRISIYARDPEGNVAELISGRPEA
jgi:catechol-2,3-dioxygenase